MKQNKTAALAALAAYNVRALSAAAVAKISDAAAKQATVDRKVAEYSAIARAELARLTALVASYEAKADPTNHAAPVANWADVNEVADLARSLKDTMPGFTSR